MKTYKALVADNKKLRRDLWQLRQIVAKSDVLQDYNLELQLRYMAVIKNAEFDRRGFG